MPAYKMEPNSLANMCKKVIFENINLKTKNLPQTGLPERTLWLATKELKEKLKNEGSDYIFLLYLLQQSSYYYDDVWRSSIFYLADEKENQNLLKKDRKLRNELIEEERKAKNICLKMILIS